MARKQKMLFAYNQVYLGKVFKRPSWVIMAETWQIFGLENLRKSCTISNDGLCLSFYCYFLWNSCWVVQDRCHGLGKRYDLMHCKGNSVYIFLFWELRGLSPNFYIHVSVSDLYIPRIGPHISSSRNGNSIVGIYNSLTDTWMWKLGLRPGFSFSGNICFQFPAFFLCSVEE